MRRTEGVPVRRWLQLGAASTGMGAALWAMSVVGPQPGQALADDGGASASSERSTSSDDGPEKPAVTKAARTANVSAAATTAADTDETDPEPADEAERTVDAEDTDTDIDAPDDETDSDVETDRPETDPADEPAADEIAPTTTSLPSADDPWGMLQEADPVDPYRENTSAVIAGVTANAELLIDALAMPPALQDALTGTLWTVRRTLFNLAPTMDQSYSVTAGLGTVVGQVSATDPEGDQIYYTVVQDPRYGSLTLDIDGSYTYTPTAGFDGVDTFVIAANDLGWHVNLLEPFRATGASASFLLNQNAIDFSFT
ncbi:MAG: Ig-like domain-containing protein, partial [Actinomycetota bacterium]|nr:Ig-like domain-containing protein [Actinomycetota bacterium]